MLSYATEKCGYINKPSSGLRGRKWWGDVSNEHNCIKCLHLDRELIYRFFFHLPSFSLLPFDHFHYIFFLKVINKLFFIGLRVCVSFHCLWLAFWSLYCSMLGTFISSNNMLFLGLRLASLNCYICMLLNTQSFTVKCVRLRPCASWVTIMGKVVWYKTSLFWSLTCNHAMNLLSERQNSWKLQCCTTWWHWRKKMGFYPYF